MMNDGAYRLLKMGDGVGTQKLLRLVNQCIG